MVGHIGGLLERGMVNMSEFQLCTDCKHIIRRGDAEFYKCAVHRTAWVSDGDYNFDYCSVVRKHPTCEKFEQKDEADKVGVWEKFKRWFG